MGIKESFRTRLTNIFGTLPDNSNDFSDYSRNVSSGMDVNATKMAFESFSDPVWGPEISGAGAFSREGYVSKSFEIPVVPFKTQVAAAEVDEDIQIALNTLTSQITGGRHYWKGIHDDMVDYITEFSHDIDFDWIDTILVKELLGFGNSVWKPRLGIKYIRGKDDLLNIPISSFARVWWDRQRMPYKLEFRGAEWQGYHDPKDVMHFIWNPIDSSAFGVGLITALTAVRNFQDITANGAEDKQRPSLLDMKLSTQLTMHLTERRYIPHNVYNAVGSSANDRAAIKASLKNLKAGEDFVSGTQIQVQELGSAQRAFDPTRFTDNVLGPIMKGLNSFRGKQANESSHQYANAKTASTLDEIGMSSFPQAVQRQLADKLFRPWYELNPMYGNNYGGGMVSVPWKECKFELEFGEAEKTDLEPDVLLKLIESAINTGAVFDPVEKRELYEKAGLPMSKIYTDEIMMNGGMNPMGMGMPMDPNMMNGGQNPSGMPPQQPQGMPMQYTDPRFVSNVGSAPMNKKTYDDMAKSQKPPKYSREPIDP
jgi:hypothetical protein